MTYQNPSSSTPRTKICVYSGANDGASLAHLEAARDLDRAIAVNNIDLVYGSGIVGLMGEIAKILVSINGPRSVHGIIPVPLLEYRRDGLCLLGHIPEEATFGRSTVFKDMPARKKLMTAEILAGRAGSGFVGLSGGFGAMEEIFEMTSWIRLGKHTRGIVLRNIEVYWNSIIQ
ncbi:hypothetical protein ACHAPI_006048 [Fusarium lateritium]